MIAVAPAIESLSLNITEEIHVHSSLTATFAALLEEMGPSNEGQNSAPMPMTSSPGPAVAGSAISATTTGTCGVTFKRSSGQRCSRSQGP